MLYWRSLANETDCKYARKCGRIIDTLFATVQPGASPEQCAAVHDLLAELGQDLLREAAKDTFHFSAANGSHRCVVQALHDAKARLMVLRLSPPPEPAPEPPAPPPAPPKPRSLSDVVKDYAGMTDIATDEDKPNGE